MSAGDAIQINHRATENTEFSLISEFIFFSVNSVNLW